MAQDGIAGFRFSVHASVSAIEPHTLAQDDNRELRALASALPLRVGKRKPGNAPACPCIICLTGSRCALAGNSALLLTRGRRVSPPHSVASARRPKGQRTQSALALDAQQALVSESSDEAKEAGAH